MFLLYNTIKHLVRVWFALYKWNIMNLYTKGQGWKIIASTLLSRNHQMLIGALQWRPIQMRKFHKIDLNFSRKARWQNCSSKHLVKTLQHSALRCQQNKLVFHGRLINLIRTFSRMEQIKFGSKSFFRTFKCSWKGALLYFVSHFEPFWKINRASFLNDWTRRWHWTLRKEWIFTV